MANVNKVKIDGAWYDIEDTTARDSRLPLAGGTMTGVLDTKSNIRIHNSNITYGTAPSDVVYGNPVKFCDKDNNVTGQVSVIYRANGRNELQMLAYQDVDGASKFNFLRLGVDTGNNQTVEISSDAQDAWFSAVVGDSSWGHGVISANVQQDSGEVYWKKVGRLCIVVVNGVKINAYTSGQLKLVEIPYPPKTASATAFCGNVNVLGIMTAAVGAVGSNPAGSLMFSAGSSIAAGGTLRGSMVYYCG